MRLLRLWSWPWVRRHAIRYTLLVLGVAAGVATPVAIYGGARAVWKDVAATLETMAGRADLVLTAGEAGVPESLLERVQTSPAVQAAAPVIEVLTELDDGARLLVLALDLTGDGALRPWLGGRSGALRVDPITFIAQPDSVLLAAPLARRRGWQAGSRIRLRTATGVQTLTVRGLLDDPELERLHGGNLAIMDVYGAQYAFSRGNRFDRVEVMLRPDVDLERARAELTALAGSGITAESPRARGEPLARLLASYGALQAFAAVFAALLGVMMIDASFRLAVTQRRVEIGILRALGATRGQVQRVFLAEGLATGAIGAALGLALGWSVYNGAARLMGGGFRSMLGGLAQQVYYLELTADLVCLALGTGIAISLAASWWPAREASLVSPVQALRRQPLGLPPLGIQVPVWLAPALGLAALAASLAPSALYLAMGLGVLAGLSLLPALVPGIVKRLRALAVRAFGLEGALALDSLDRSRRRTVSTVAVLALVFALGIVIGGLRSSTRRALTQWVERTFAADLLVTASPSLILQPYRFPPSFAAEVAVLPGVARVEAIRALRLPCAGQLRMVVAADEAGPAIHVSEPLRHLSHVSLMSPAGELRLPVAGVVTDYSDRAGVIFLPRSLYRQHWGDDTFDKLRVTIAAGSPPASVRDRIRAKIAGRFPATILTEQEVRESLLHPPGRRLSAVEIQLAISLLAGALALANFALISVAERTPEFALLRSLGAFRRQVRRRLLIEVLVTSAIGLAAGVLLGAVLEGYLLWAVEAHVTSMHLPYVFPGLVVLALSGVALLAGALAVAGASPSLDRIALARSLDAE